MAVTDPARRASPAPHRAVARHRGSPDRARAALLFVLLLALSWQGYVVGTHAHQPSAFSAESSYSLQRAPAHDRRAPAAPESCPICQEISVAAAYLPAPPVDFAAPALAVAWFAVSGTLRRLPRQRSHGWRSRGPPSARSFPK